MLVALLTPEPASARVVDWFKGNTTALVSADWCAVEFTSAIAAKRRAKTLRPAQVRSAQQAFEMLCAGGLRLLPVSRACCRHAANLCAAPGSILRAGDALHLAAALEADCTALAGVDRAMNQAASKLSLKLLPDDRMP